MMKQRVVFIETNEKKTFLEGESLILRLVLMSTTNARLKSRNSSS